ncbi:hypothetical protein EDD18DRAFT_1116682 [Armillaria luteobubalina]|uniref:Uncharacterized protein n=1 Tax=Armillaria luteobubalina TaxID=153913 RepID=A0AA39NYP4_9AGAR|nr:hypothetical protein EDD18DRAFT_1116682 [Armillaria luteobubalina]
MTSATTNVATRPRNLNAIRIKVTDAQPGNVATSNADSSGGEDEGYESKEDSDNSVEWSKSLNFEYMAEHEPSPALPVNYLRFTGWARSPPLFLWHWYSPIQRDTMNTILREINWREDIKWYIVGTWVDSGAKTIIDVINSFFTEYLLTVVSTLVLALRIII